MKVGVQVTGKLEQWVNWDNAIKLVKHLHIPITVWSEIRYQDYIIDGIDSTDEYWIRNQGGRTYLVIVMSNQSEIDKILRLHGKYFYILGRESDNALPDMSNSEAKDTLFQLLDERLIGKNQEVTNYDLTKSANKYLDEKNMWQNELRSEQRQTLRELFGVNPKGKVV